MSTSPQPGSQRTICVRLEQDPEVTQEVASTLTFTPLLVSDCPHPLGFCHRYIRFLFQKRHHLTPRHTALGYLYSSVSLSLIHPDNARGVLAAGCLLGGMNDLCEYAYEVCRRSITVDTINAWLDFLEDIPPNFDRSPTSDLPSTSVFGQYAQKLRDNVFHYLVVTLPNALGVNQPPPAESSPPLQDGREVLLQIYSRVPFEMFKAAVESPTFQIGKQNRSARPLWFFSFHTTLSYYHMSALPSNLRYLFQRVRSSSFQVCQGCHRHEEKGDRTRCRV